MDTLIIFILFPDYSKKYKYKSGGSFMIKEKAQMVGKEQVTNNPEKQEQDSISQYDKDQHDIINQDLGFGLFNVGGVKKIYNAKSSLCIVGIKEYLLWKPIYDHVDTLDICQKYKEKLCNCFVHLDIHIKRLYCQFANKLVCLDANLPSSETAYFCSFEGGFKFNQFNDMDENLGVCNTYFHESAHMIDYLMGNQIDNASSQAYMSEAIHQDLQNAIKEMRYAMNCDEPTAQTILTSILKRNMYDSNVVSDVFDGASRGKVHGRFRHSKDYWILRPADALGKEAFAEILADIACQSTSHIEFTKRYLPNTMLKFNKLMKGK